MIKDLSIIREFLTDYSEVEMPYDFVKECPIHYITSSIDDEGNLGEESFFPNCKFIRICNDVLVVEYNCLEKKIQICRRSKSGEVIYKSRFFIPENIDETDETDENKSELMDVITNQQSIIEKLIERIKDVELQKHELTETMTTYEDLLQEGRFKLKELSVEVRDKTKKIDHYEELIPKLYNSR